MILLSTAGPSRPLQHNSYTLAVAYSPDGKTICTGSWDSTTSLWHAITGELILGSLRSQECSDANHRLTR
ncbi:hypothetical protein BS17DRAFT_325791 [Gyrodon lividus]|nr:hypothetical protein BS17DRAFT_325791 [Gyrodon lividus]